MSEITATIKLINEIKFAVVNISHFLSISVSFYSIIGLSSPHIVQINKHY